MAEHKYVLELPWEDRKHHGVKYDPAKKIYIYKGDTLPTALQRYRTDDFSYSRWVEDDMNGTPLRSQKGAVTFKPRQHQVDGGKSIFKHYYSGHRGTLLADKMGVGKTMTTLVGLSAIAKKEGYSPKNKANLLVVCPKGVIPQWRHTLRNYPIATSLMRVMVINYQQLNKLLQAPNTAKTAKKARTKNRQTAGKGKPWVDWDFVVFDEAQAAKNYPVSEASMACASVASLNNMYKKGKTPFVVFSTATPGATPLNYALMAGILAPLISNKPEAKKVTPDTWPEFLLGEGFAVKKGKVNWSWAPMPFYGKNSDDPKERARYLKQTKEAKKVQRNDALRIGRAWKKASAPFIMRSPSDLAG